VTVTSRTKQKFRNSMRQFVKIAAFIEQFCQAESVAGEDVSRILVSVEEVFTNTVSYGFKDDSDHWIVIELKKDRDALEVEIVDDGIPYDPLTEAPEPDISVSLEDRQIGGLGVLMVKYYMDDLSYSHDGIHNRLKMTLKLDQVAP
jgi:anti-sigma regulatory factor (Ser/Thr protein kinase)